MPASPTTCPTCSSVDVRRTEAETWRCNRCDTLFAVVDGAPVVRVPGDPQLTDSGRPGLVALGLVLAIVVGVGAGLGWRSLQQGEARVVEPGPRASREPVDTTPDIELDHERHGKRLDGTSYWMMTYRSLARGTIANPTLVATLFDADGKVIATHRASAPFDHLGPGEEVPILVVAEGNPEYHRAEVLAQAPELATGRARHLPIGTEKVADVGDNRIRGKLRNLGDDTLRVTTVVAIGQDEEGRPVAWATGKAEEQVLRKGDVVEFEAVLEEYVVARPARWTAMASGVVIDR